MNDGLIRELGERLLKALPSNRYMELSEIRKVFRKKIIKTSDSDIWEVVIFLIKRKSLFCSTEFRYPDRIPGNVVIADDNIIIDGQRFSCAFKPENQ